MSSRVNMVFVAHADQTRTDQRSAGEIEGRLSFLGRKPGQAGIGIGHTTQVVLDQRQAAVGREQVKMRFAVPGDEDRTQGFMAGEQGIQAAPPCRNVQRSAQTQGHRDIVGDTVRIELRQKPQPLLSIG